MALQCNFRYCPRHAPRPQRLAAQLGCLRSRSAQRTCTVTSAAAADIEASDEGCTVDWDYVGDGTPDAAIADAWDYRYMDEAFVEANLADAATYRMLVQRLPKILPNVKDLRGFRDNVTKKVAPAIARALFAHLSCAEGAAALVAGLASFASYRGAAYTVQQFMIPLFAAAVPSQSEGRSFPALQHLTHDDLHGGSSSKAQPINVHVEPCPFASTASDLVERGLQTRSGRRRRWGAHGRRSLAGAGRKGLMDPALGVEHTG